jgi:hypothetical protein
MIENRMDVINHLIKKFGYSNYLEIGVRDGECIRKILCANKHGVDPYKACVEVTHHMTSDEFFQNHCNQTYDIIFIDGNHDSDYVCRDLNNSLKVLSPNGSIVMHDCFPSKKEWATKQRDVIHPIIAWNGDGFRVVTSVVTKYSDVISMCVVDIDHGVGVVRKKVETVPTIVYDDSYSFETMSANPIKEINLVSVEKFLEMF